MPSSVSRRTVLALTAALLAGSAAPALAAPLATDAGTVCVFTDYNAKTGDRKGVCVWAPVERPSTP